MLTWKELSVWRTWVKDGPRSEGILTGVGSMTSDNAVFCLQKIGGRSVKVVSASARAFRASFYLGGSQGRNYYDTLIVSSC